MASSERLTIRRPFLRMAIGMTASSEQALVPVAPEQLVAGQEARQQKRDARANPTALVGDLDRERSAARRRSPSW